MDFQRHKNFTLIELLVVIAIIGILISVLLPSLKGARLSAQSAVCKSNMSQICRAQMIYAKDNNRRVWAASFGASWLTAKKTRMGQGIEFHDGQQGFMEPYLGKDDSLVYNCPATDYDKTSQFYTFHKGKSYEGFLNIVTADPIPIEKMHADLDANGSQIKFFEDASRKPFFWDYTAEIGSTDNFFYIGNSSIHGNTGKLNLAVTDGSVITMKLDTAYWNVFCTTPNNWLAALESALGETGN